MKNSKPGSSSGRRRRVETYADWCARIDSQVEEMAGKIGGEKPPAYLRLNSVQRRIVDRLVAQLLQLPPVSSVEDTRTHPQYARMHGLLGTLLAGHFGLGSTISGLTAALKGKKLSHREQVEFLVLMSDFGPVPTSDPKWREEAESEDDDD